MLPIAGSPVNAKPFFQQLQIFSWESDVAESDKSQLEVAWEALAEAATTLFKNQPAEQFATASRSVVSSTIPS